MKILNIIPQKSRWIGLTIWPFLIKKKGYTFTDIQLNHERIHAQQQKEMLLIPFFACYLLEWIFRAITGQKAYRNLSFEREAYANEKNLDYIKGRRFWSWLKYLKTG